jgi:hypothetical protein
MILPQSSSSSCSTWVCANALKANWRTSPFAYRPLTLALPPSPSVPEGRCDRSLARSAWDSATPKEPSRRVRSDSCRCAHRSMKLCLATGLWRIQRWDPAGSAHDTEQQRTRTFREGYLAFRNTAHISTGNTSGIAEPRSSRTLWDGSFEPFGALSLAQGRDAFPGTSCQTTIGVVPTGRASRHFATASC